MDEKTFIILEELNKTGRSTQPILYEATKPTIYPALQRRLDNLKEAGLIEEHLGGVNKYYEVTNFGVQVSMMLDTNKNLDL
jgi:DNA-binding Lrp family transcriptional regulator